jgi:hypothetical protein
VPANVIMTRDGTIHRRSIGLPLAKTAIRDQDFLDISEVTQRGMDVG